MSISPGHLSEEELSIQIEKVQDLVEIGALYAHYRDSTTLYKVVGLGIIEATHEVGVLYQKAFGSAESNAVVWIRPISSWTEKVNTGINTVPRFLKVT